MTELKDNRWQSWKKLVRQSDKLFRFFQKLLFIILIPAFVFLIVIVVSFGSFLLCFILSEQVLLQVGIL